MDSKQQTDPSGSEVRDVEVDILLTGGHRYAVTLASDSIILVNLMRALTAKLAWPAGQDPTLFQIPLNDGRTALTFCDSDLAGLTTTPPVLVHSGDPVWKREQLQGLTREPAVPPDATVISSPWMQVDDVLSGDDLARLIDGVMAREDELRPSEVTTKVEGYRKSRVLFDFPEFSELVVARVRALLPSALRTLAIAPFHIARVEAQLTAHNDGDFFRVHPDSGSDETATRELTFVYYFNCEPKGYSGGELILYDSRKVQGALEKADSFSLVEPRCNSMVLFPSRCFHEVLPVRCESGTFRDSRFTINGWLRRDGAAADCQSTGK